MIQPTGNERNLRNHRFSGVKPKPQIQQMLMPIIIRTNHPCGTDVLSVAMARGNMTTNATTVVAAKIDIVLTNWRVLEDFLISSVFIF